MKTLPTVFALVVIGASLAGCSGSQLKSSPSKECQGAQCKNSEGNPETKPPVKNNTPPELDAISNKTVLINEILEFIAVGRDADGDELKYEISSLPNASIDPKTGAFKWQPIATQQGEQKVTVKVTDSKGASATREVSIFASNGTNPPERKFDLCEDGSKAGREILFFSFYTSGDVNRLKIDELRTEVATKGFSLTWMTKDQVVDSVTGNLTDFSRYDQIWMMPSDTASANGKDSLVIAQMKAFFDSNKGIGVLADNEPYFLQANQLALALNLAPNPTSTALFSGSTGDNGGLVTVQKSAVLSPATAIDHPLFTGLVKFSGGITLSAINIPLLGPNAKLLAISPFGAHSIAAVEDVAQPKKAPVVFDSGFTKIYDTEINKEGTRRYYRNLACYLTERK